MSVHKRPADPDQPRGELKRLRANSGATIDELRQFVAQMRGKSPQEVLGLVAQSGLTQGIALSALATAVLVLAFTLIPYYLSSAEAAAPPEAQAPPPAATADEQPAEASAGGDAATATTPAGKKTNEERAAEALGIGETKGATADDVPPDPTDIDALLDN